MPRISNSFRADPIMCPAKAGVLAIVMAALAGCAGSRDVGQNGINDPYEFHNRRMHEINKSLDRAIIRPLSRGYVSAAPEGAQDAVGHFAQNLATPGVVVNDLLQFKLGDALVNTFRFVVNSTVGIGGLVDAAEIYGVPPRKTDFGETLHVWGVPEGAYVELPVLGPSTERDRIGVIVDFFTNPLSYGLNSPEKYAGPAAKVLDRLGSRGRYSQTVDGVLYESADSYAQSRITYLQNRRYELGGSSGQDTGDDPYGTSDAYSDPYTDPYIE